MTLKVYSRRWRNWGSWSQSYSQRCHFIFIHIHFILQCIYETPIY